jgi:ribonuclease T2
MQTYWKDQSGSDETFWEHEWSKHGTCINTLKPTCYTNYQAKQELVDFFTKTVSLFQGLPSYQWLAAAGITPSTTATYTAAAIQSALQSNFGQQVTINCASGALNEIWYHYNVQGSVQSGSFVPVAPDSGTGTCPSTGSKKISSF